MRTHPHTAMLFPGGSQPSDFWAWPTPDSSWDRHQVRLLNPQTGQLLREHLRQARCGHRIQDEGRSKKTPLGMLALLNRADKAGSQIGGRLPGPTQDAG